MSPSLDIADKCSLDTVMSSPNFAINLLKRKVPPEERDSDATPSPLSSVPSEPPRSEPSSTRVVCKVCSHSISFLDEETGNFTIKHWDAHQAACNPPVHDQIPNSEEKPSTHSLVKRRRAKRTEEERIDYLRNDPYVAQFEPYRVLCASCNKWIRLRPNSTYCSIPWDAHRKSCLSKKNTNKSQFAAEERSSFFLKDASVRKFDAERVLCGVCDCWIAVDPNDHLRAVRDWSLHRASCQQIDPNNRERAPTAVPSSPTDTKRSPPRLSIDCSRSSHSVPQPLSSKSDSDSWRQSLASPYSAHPESASSAHDLSVANTHESRRRNAEQRAAALRADPLIGQVEANRVFCSLCQKWVQLRQDSSYCAYPWLQHRGKCLARQERRTKRAAERAKFRAAPTASASEQDELMSEDGEGDVESEEAPDSVMVLDSEGKGTKLMPEDDCVLVHGSCEEDGDNLRTCPRRPIARPHRKPSMLADLDSSSGRKNFVLSSINYLFMTTYDSTDDLTISSLLTYLNAMIPSDKHEEFDTTEVIKAVASFHEKRKVIFEGDVIRRVN